MAFAICGNLPYALQVQSGLEDSGMDITFFVKDLVYVHGDNLTTKFPFISFFEFRRLVSAGELDGLVIAEDFGSGFTKDIVQLCKLYSIPKVYVTVS